MWLKASQVFDSVFTKTEQKLLQSFWILKESNESPLSLSSQTSFYQSLWHTKPESSLTWPRVWNWSRQSLGLDSGLGAAPETTFQGRSIIIMIITCRRVRIHHDDYSGLPSQSFNASPQTPWESLPQNPSLLSSCVQFNRTLCFVLCLVVTLITMCDPEMAPLRVEFPDLMPTTNPHSCTTNWCDLRTYGFENSSIGAFFGGVVLREKWSNMNPQRLMNGFLQKSSFQEKF